MQSDPSIKEIPWKNLEESSFESTENIIVYQRHIPFSKHPWPIFHALNIKTLASNKSHPGLKQLLNLIMTPLSAGPPAH